MYVLLSAARVQGDLRNCVSCAVHTATWCQGTKPCSTHCTALRVEHEYQQDHSQPCSSVSAQRAERNQPAALAATIPWQQQCVWHPRVQYMLACKGRQSLPGHVSRRHAVEINASKTLEQVTQCCEENNLVDKRQKKKLSLCQDMAALTISNNVKHVGWHAFPGKPHNPQPASTNTTSSSRRRWQNNLLLEQHPASNTAAQHPLSPSSKAQRLC